MYEVKVRAVHDTSGLFSQGDFTNKPCPAILVGPDALNSRHYRIEYYLSENPPKMKDRTTSKPPYSVPGMTDIKALPWNGYNAISTFSGCGGSSLGYKMAGFKVLWASEFVPAAQEVYRLNHDGTFLDTRDIRQVQPEEILAQIGMRPGDLDLLDGSPPCASFSTAGKREKGWGEVKKYSDTRQRTDDLFFEYARILRGLQPKVFVAENVSGLVKGKAKGYFKMILAALKDCGYNVKAKLLDAQWLGVPQMRQRLIFIGVREDLGLQPVFPAPLPYRYSVREAIPWIVEVEMGKGFGEMGIEDAGNTPYMTVGTSPSSGNGLASNVYAVEPESSIEGYAIGNEWDRLGPKEKGKYLNFVKPAIDEPCPTVTQAGGNTSAASVVHPLQKRKFSIAELRRICGFPDDFKLVGTYAQQWERLGRAVPPVMMSHIATTVRDEILAKL